MGKEMTHETKINFLFLIKRRGQAFCVDEATQESFDYKVKRVKKHFKPMFDNGWELFLRENQITETYFEDQKISVWRG